MWTPLFDDVTYVSIIIDHTHKYYISSGAYKALEKPVSLSKNLFHTTMPP
jgi:hypothetical protein